MTDLRVNFMGIKLKNPFLLACGPEATAANFLAAAEAGWAGGVLWAPDSKNPWPEYQGFNRGYVPREFQTNTGEFIGKSRRWWAYQNNGCEPEQLEHIHIPERMEASIRESKKAGIVVGQNITERSDPEAWVEAASVAERSGVDFIELNFSCPYISEIGMTVGRDEKLQQTITRIVRKQVSIPIEVKLNAIIETDMLQRMAKQALNEGANGIAITNTLPGFIGVDIESGIPLACELGLDGRMRGVTGGISGPAIKPIALRGVAEVYRATKAPVSGIGGIIDWRSAVEFMLLGASTVQLCTAVLFFGYGIVKDMIRGLEDYMERKSYKNIEDFVGLTNEKYSVGESYSVSAKIQPKRMTVDQGLCTACGMCVIACRSSSSGSGACTMEEGVAHINPKLCHTCNTCRIVCPSLAIKEEWDAGYPI